MAQPLSHRDSCLPERPRRAPAPSAEECPLPALEMGAWAVVERVDAVPGLSERLLDLGFVPGTRIRVARRAPLGDPVEYALRGTRLCLRRADAAHVRVRPLAAPPEGDGESAEARR